MLQHMAIADRSITAAPAPAIIAPVKKARLAYLRRLPGVRSIL
jgi:hypothetical protein